MVIVDTDIIIWILRGDRGIEEKFKSLVVIANGEVFITPIQIAEIYSGIRPKERIKAENFIESLNIITIDKAIGKLAGEFINQYGKSHNVTMADALIGACAKINGFKIWTLNKKHYPMFSGTGFFK